MTENVELDAELLDKINNLLEKDAAEDETDKCVNPIDGGDSVKRSRKLPRYKLFDLEKSESVQQEEVLFINGTEIKLHLPEERALINKCLATGQIDDFALLKRILENTGLSITLPASGAGGAHLGGGPGLPLVTTNLSVKHVDVLQENIRIKKVNKAGEVVEVSDEHVTTTSDEKVIERVDVLRTGTNAQLRDGRQWPREVRRLPRPDDDDEDDIRMKIFQNIIEEDSGIQDEYLFQTGHVMGPPHCLNSNSLDDFYSTDLSSTTCSISPAHSTRDYIKPLTGQEVGGDGSSCSYRRDDLMPKAEMDTKSIFYRDGMIVSAHLDALIRHLVPTETYTPDSNYIFTFLLCSRLFLPPEALFDRVAHEIALLADPYRLGRRIESVFFDWAHKFPYDFVQAELKKKLEEFLKKSNFLDAQFRHSLLYDLNERLAKMHLYENYLGLLRQVVVSNQHLLLEEMKPEDLGQQPNCITATGSGNASANNSHNPKPLTPALVFVNEPKAAAATSLVDAEQKYEAFLINSLHANNTDKRNVSAVNEMKLAVGYYQVNLYEMCPQPQIVAHQLTHIELERLAFIGPEEFVQTFVKQQQQKDPEAGACEEMLRNIHLSAQIENRSMRRDSEGSVKRKHTKNFENYVQWFNRLTYLVATDIVKHGKKRVRAKAVDFWIEVAHECFNIGNFNSLMAITTGLNLCSISRLRKTWSKVQLHAKFQILEHQMDPSSNFCSYRSTLKAAMWRSAGARTQDDGQSRIIIPFFSLLVKDLYFLNEGCSSRLPNGHINFEKLWHFSRQITDFIEWQRVQIPFERRPNIIFYLETRPILDTENKIALASFECETPDNTAEKDRFKTLKRS